METVARDRDRTAPPSGRATRSIAPTGQVVSTTRALVVIGVLVVGLIATVAAGTWGLMLDRGEEEHHHGSLERAEWVPIPGGQFAVLDLHDKTPAHASSMQGMQSMADPVPAGYRRLTVNVSLAATDGDLSLRPGDFRVSGPGLRPTRPIRAQIGDGIVPHDTVLTGELTYDVPLESRGLRLRFRSGVAVSLPEVTSSPDGSESAH